ncbi:MAG: prepilin peptidase [bacterium]
MIGSFLNVCIYRIPRQKSIVFPASHCPQCQRKLGFLDLFPILSFIFQRGKCRYCGGKISGRYPLVEFLSGLSFVTVAFAFPPEINPIGFVFSLMFILLLLMISFIDFEFQLIPDALSITGIVFGLVFHLFTGDFFNALIGLALGFGLLFLVGKLGKICFKKEALGEGDLYLAAFIGAYLGWSGLLAALFLSYLLAGAAAVFLLATGKVKMSSYVPFGPALAAGGIIVLFFGERIISWYLGISGL